MKLKQGVDELKGHPNKYWLLPKWLTASGLGVFFISIIWSVALSFGKLENVEERVTKTEDTLDANRTTIENIEKDLNEIKINFKLYLNSQGMEYIER